MYCKYCGSRIASDTTKCISCGAKIDLNDGGQSFFDDHELSEWQSDIVSYNAQTSIPKTEMREPLLPQANFEKEDKTDFSELYPRVSAGALRSRAHTKKKKNRWDSLNLSSSNKLIIFCIASALVIVLLAVTIIAVLNSGDETTDENASQDNTSRYMQSADSAITEQNNNQPTPTETQNNELAEKEPAKQENTQDVLNDKTEIKDIKIFDRDGNEISYSVSAYIDENNILYVSLDQILKHEGYKNGTANGNDSNRILYEHQSSGQVIEIEKGTNKIWITEPGEEAVTQWLDAENFNVGDHTYIPVRSFLTKYGYDENEIKWDEKEKTLYFSN